MADGVAYCVIPNEYYELKDAAAISFHPHPPLTDFKIVMVAESAVHGAVVFKWPSFKSLAFFVNDSLDVLPKLDQEFTVAQFDASRMVKCRIDLVALCFNRGWAPEAWLHAHAMDKLGAEMNMISVDRANRTQNNRVRTDHFYAFSCVDFPRDTAVALTGSPRVAWVSRKIDGQNDGHPTVEVRFPSMASLRMFDQSGSLALPAFDQVFSISSESARHCLKRILPIQLCFRLRKRSDFWMNENRDQVHNHLLSKSRAGAGAGV